MSLSFDSLKEADRAALERILEVRPALTALRLAGDAIDLPEFTVLHAGPPYDDLASIPQPVQNSAILASLFEGWAENVEEGRDLIGSGKVSFVPAQDRDAVTPLAAVVSPSMAVQVVEDLAGRGCRIVSPLNGGSGAAMRYGKCSPEVLEKIAWLNETLFPVMKDALSEPVELLPLAEGALHNGDDCHGRTVRATQHFTELLRDRLGREFEVGEAAEFLGQSPSFFLNIWMAASKCVLSAADGTPHATLVTAMGGNGIDSGIQVAGLPRRWFTAAATAPQGALASDAAEKRSLGAIGDSAVVEALGLGAMTWYHFAEDLREGLEAYLPVGGKRLPERLLLGEHPGFSPPRPRVGLSAAAVVEASEGPIVSLGIVDRAGSDGLLARGVYRAPLAPFQAAVEAVSAK